MTPTDDRARLAAANNADLYGLVFKAHGLAFRRDSSMFVSSATPPPYYGSMTTLDPGDTSRQMLAIETLKIDRGGAFGLKDGFCRLDLKDDGFRVLFEAAWVWAPAHRFGSPVPADWERVETPEALGAWEGAWSATSPAERRVFQDALLSEPDISFFGRRSGESFDAGCVANRSPGCVGLSNVFATEQDTSLYATVARLAVDFARGRPVVGYDQSDALRVMSDCGFDKVGPLRLWVIESP